MARTQQQPATPQQAHAPGDAMRPSSRHARRGASKGPAPAPAAAPAVKDVRTKVVVRHLPPTMGAGALAEELEARYGGMYTWMTFRAGKASHKRQVHSVAYLNFRRPEDVLRFHDEFDGHAFVNEKGAQYKVVVEYAPYQRVPKPRSKKDVREGTILKDPDYMQFVEALGKPQEFLPSAEVQLERREAEKAAASANGAKESVVVTPLMEFVRQRRAAKAGPQRSMAGKLTSRLGSQAMKVSARGEKAAGILSEGEVASRYESRDRREVIDRRRKDGVEGKEKKLVREAVAAALSSARATARGGDPGAELSGRDGVNEADVELSSRGPSPASCAGSGAGAGYSHRGRPPQSPKHGSSQTGGGGVSVTAISKPSHGKDATARGSRGMVANQVSLLQASSAQTPSQPETQQQQSFQQAERGSKADKLDARRVRNKDRPDRPVWTPRRRADSGIGTESSVSPSPTAASALLASSVNPAPVIPTTPSPTSAAAGLHSVPDLGSKTDKGSRTAYQRQGVKSPGGQVFERSVDMPSFGQTDALLENPPPSRKTRYSESTGYRTPRGARPFGSYTTPDNLAPVDSDGRADSASQALPGDVNGPGSLENGEPAGSITLQSVGLKDRRKPDLSLLWNELGGTPKHVGRRDRNSQQGSREFDGFPGVPDGGKSVKRGGAVGLGGSEKQVWVAVQKAGTGP